MTILDQEFLPIFQVKVNERGWLGFNIVYKIGEYAFPHELFENLLTEYLHVDGKILVKVDYNPIHDVNMALEALDAKKTDSGYRIEITRFLFFEEVIEYIGGIKEVSAEYQQFKDKLTDFKHNPEFKLPSEYEQYMVENGITLRPYQRAGIHWLHWLTSHHLHVILADDMGLGKTIQTIAAMRLLHESTKNMSPSLIVCPKSVIGHWRREIKRVFSDIGVFVYIGPWRNPSMFRFEEPSLFITTYATMSRDIEMLKEIPFFFVVLDEGTRIKNLYTKRAKAAKTLNAAHRLVLSGTPIENRPVELWSLFDFLMKDHLGSYNTFIYEYEVPIQDEDAQAAEDLAKRIKPFILRRMKEEVEHDIPEKIEMKHYCELTQEQRAIYGQLQNRYISPVRRALREGAYVNYTKSVLPAITKLKQVCDHPALINQIMEPLLGRSEKFDFIIETIKEIIKKNEAAVLFSYFLGSLNLFESYLQKHRISYIRIDGSTQHRQALIDKFNTGIVSIALCSLMAAGHGINLTSASHVIHVDRWWNPATEDQATDRVHRIGQTKPVYVYKVLTEGTLEEKIDLLLEKKRGISDKVIGAATKGVKGWTREELLEILKPIDP
jgi:SNF2 family DNA or RNA helicase